jgi:hypothetical protein
MLTAVEAALLLNRSTRAAHARQTAVQLELVLQAQKVSAKSSANQVLVALLSRLQISKSAQTLAIVWRSLGWVHRSQIAQPAQHRAQLLQ